MERSANENLSPSKALRNPGEEVVIDKRHLTKMSDHDLAVMVAPLLVEEGITTKYWLETRWEYLRRVVGLLKDRAECLADFVSVGKYFFFFDRNYDPHLVAELFTSEAANVLSILAKRFADLTEFTTETTEQVLSSLAEEMRAPQGHLVRVTRLAVSGTTVGPELSEVLVVLTQPIVVERLKKAVDYIRAKRKL